MPISIDKARYILLATRKKDGSMVDTPVWFSGENGEYYAFSAANAGKIKRLKNFTTVQLTPCTVTGKSLGNTIAANAEIIIDPEQIYRAHLSLLQKYGWQLRILDFCSRLSGKIQQRAFIRIIQI